MVKYVMTIEDSAELPAGASSSSEDEYDGPGPAVVAAAPRGKKAAAGARRKGKKPRVPRAGEEDDDDNDDGDDEGGNGGGAFFDGLEDEPVTKGLGASTWHARGYVTRELACAPAARLRAISLPTHAPRPLAIHLVHLTLCRSHALRSVVVLVSWPLSCFCSMPVPVV